MHIHCPMPSLQHALAATLLQLTLLYVVCTTCLRYVALNRILILNLVVVAIPICLASHEAERGDKEGSPLSKSTFSCSPDPGPKALDLSYL